MISEHFKDSELACKHCGRNLVTKTLLEALEAFRSAVGKPVTVNSAYRCPEHNKAVGGAPNSQHVLGQAADVSVKGKTPSELEAIARKIPEIRGIGRADHHGYIHIDVRHLDTPKLATDYRFLWCYDESNKQTAYYAPKPTANV